MRWESSRRFSRTFSMRTPSPRGEGRGEGFSSPSPPRGEGRGEGLSSPSPPRGEGRGEGFSPSNSRSPEPPQSTALPPFAPGEAPRRFERAGRGPRRDRAPQRLGSPENDRRRSEERRVGHGRR